MNTDGTNQQNIGINGFQSKWSADGSKFIYTSSKDGDWEIYSCKINGTNDLRITSNSSNDYNAIWSPDGTRIAFASEKDGNSEIYTMNSNGTIWVRLTNNNAYDGTPK